MVPEIFKVLFVCTGNICRSPTAEAVFLHLVQSRNLDDRIAVDSAGTGSWHAGEAPDRRSLQAALSRGIDIGKKHARTVLSKDFPENDLIVAMDSSHLQTLKASCPTGYLERLRLFMDYAPEAGITDVPDPYYGAGDGFARVFDMIELASKGLLRDIEENHLT